MLSRWAIKIKNILLLIVVTVFSIAIIGYFFSPSTGGLSGVIISLLIILLCLIFLGRNTGIKSLIVKPKIYYVLLLIFGLVLSIIILNIDKKHYDKIKISVLSLQTGNTINFGNNVTGEIVFDIEGTDKAFIEGKEYSVTSGKVIYYIDLTGRTTKILNISGNNNYYKAEESFNIVRNSTSDEIKKAEEESALLKKQEDDKIMAEKTLQEKSDREKAQLQSKYEKMSSNGYIYEIEKKLHSLGFKQIDSGFSKAQDGSTQVETTYEGHENGYTITITLQPSYSLGEHYYSVSVK